jgi:hypothetical protein
VARTGGYRDQVTGLAQHLQHLVTQVQIEDTGAFHKEAHLVIGMGVLFNEFLAQGGAVRVGGLYAHRVHRGEAMRGGQLCYFLFVRGQDGRCIGIGGQYAQVPAFKLHAGVFQGLRNGGVVARAGGGLLWSRCVVGGECGHGLNCKACV